MYHTSMQSPSRSLVLASRLVLASAIYFPLVLWLRHDGRSWYYALFTPAVTLTFGYVIGTVVALLMITAAGLPLPWDLKKKHDVDRTG